MARDGQRFCYRCGHELGEYYDSLKIKIDELMSKDASKSESDDSPASRSSEIEGTALPGSKAIPSSTVVLDPNAFDTKIDTPAPESHRASLKILLPTGDVFDRELSSDETQIGKGPRNDIVIADPAVSAAHAVIRLEGESYTIKDIGSRNGTFVNGERVSANRPLHHGDVIGMGLSKLTFRLSDYSETGEIQLDDLAAATAKAGPPPLTEESLAAAVVSAGLVSKSDVDRLRADGSRRLHRALVESRLASEETFRDLMSRTFQIQSVDLNSVSIDKSAVDEFPPKLAREHRVFAFAKDSGALLLAVADPTDTAKVEQVKSEVRSPVNVRLATASQIREKLDKYYCPKLIGVLPSGEKLEYPIDKQEVEIGKAAHNHIVLADPTVSNTHAIVIAREGGYSIVDLGSRNGTFVNSERLGEQSHTLRHGDRVQVGRTVLTFRNPGETDANVTAVLSAAALEEVRTRSGTHDTQEASAENPQSEQAAAGLASVVAADVATQTAQTEAPEDSAESEKKKKKKKKKKEKDDRLRAAYIGAMGRVIAAILSVALTVALTLYLTRSGSPGKDEIKLSKKGHAKLKLPKPGAGTAFSDGMFEASGVVQVPGTNGVLFVDDRRLDEVLWMQVDESGKQVGAVKSVPLGASISDMEAITYDDGAKYYYVTGSQSDPKDGSQNAIARFRFDPASQTARETEVIGSFRDFVLANVPELKGDGEKGGKDGGLNIEGIAWDVSRTRILLGLRSPQANGDALIIPISFRKQGGPFSIDNMTIERAIHVPLDGLGIRDIEFDKQLDAFLIIAGAPEHHDKKLGFKLWQWSGDAADAGYGVQALTDLDAVMKPEGVTHFESGGREFIFIVGDAGSYLKLDYSESQ